MNRSRESSCSVLFFRVQESLVSFEEVAVYFSEEEWSQLDSDEKALHSEVMLENHRNVVSLGKNFLVPNQTFQEDKL
uniref:KRAB domain-containing protein n=1 Tax=Pseudonaja textilis TaxID=8673 RepID=A0A670Z6U5_PSETE